MQTIRTSKKTRFLSASAAFFLWGGWAFFVNDDGGGDIGATAAITQGVYSFIVTLLMTHCITFLFNRLSTTTARIILPPTITVCTTGCILYFIHHLAGTPSIALTIAPALTVAFLFSLYIVSTLHTTLQHRKNDRLRS